MSSSLRQLADQIAAASRLTILTGAGVSAASGVPTFRGAAGLWRQFRPEELATPEAFRRDPSLVWEWYAWRRGKIASCEPNAAHHVIARWSQRDGCRVITQNVDDLHVRAGTRNLTRLHGSIWEMRCWYGCGQSPWTGPPPPRPCVSGKASGSRNGVAPGQNRDDRVDGGDLGDGPPRCPSCGGLARPAVVWFGESLDPAHLEAALDACNCDLFLTVGTSAIVYPAAGLVHEARRRGAFTAEINLDATAASSAVDVSIRGAAEEILPLLTLPR